MRLPGFTAQSSLPANRNPWRGEMHPAPKAGVVRPAQNPALDACLEGCTATPWPDLCATACWAKYAFDLYGDPPIGPKTGPPDYPEYEPPGGIPVTVSGLLEAGAAVLAGIALGTFAGYEIEEHGGITIGVGSPQSCTPASGCNAVGPNTQHQITEGTPLGRERAKRLAWKAADDDCKTRPSRCAGTCPKGNPCTPYAQIWNTSDGPALFYSSATAYYTCQCGC